MIGGNITASIQICTTSGNSIGEAVKEWYSIQDIKGWLDLSGGDSKYSTYNAKIQESTHIFISDFTVLDSKIRAENSRMIIKNQVYDVLLIDDPMDIHKQIEIYLKYTGGQ